jgi:hypothetical protein
MDAQPRKNRAGWLVVALLLFVAFAQLAWRGPLSIRGHWNLIDFASPWASARQWLTGGNPYDNEPLWETWSASRGAFDTDHTFWVALMPPGAYAVLAPFAALPAGVAGVVWLLVSAASVFAILACTLSLARIPAGSLTAWLLVAAALASAPVQTIVTVGQLSLPVIALAILAMWLARGGRDLLAGLALGLAAAVKPQLVAPFFLYYAFFARWRLLLPAAVLAFGINLLAVAPMQLRGIPWWADWSRNMQIASAPGGPNDPTASGPWRNQMIDLRAWFYTLTEAHHLVTAKALLVSLALAAAYVALLARRRQRGPRHDAPLALATLAALTLLPVYHKMYDATLLVLALAWALRALQGPGPRGVAVATLLALCVFLVPFDFLPLLMKRTNALDALSQTWLWRVVIFPHHALATLATALCLLYAFWRSVRLPEPERAARTIETPEASVDELVSIRG